MASRAKRRLGQHFLSDPSILARIADTLEADAGSTVLEIGPGHGGLTEALALRAGRVIAIERDLGLIAPLRHRLPNVEVVEGDALGLDWHRLVGSPFLVAGNIPYNITSPLLEKALLPPRPSRIVFLVQREVADRLTAEPGTREYGGLTVGVQSVARAERLFGVPAGAFRPVPMVDSVVVRLTPLDPPLVDEAEQAGLRRLTVGLFGFRRKQIGRGLRQLTGWEGTRVQDLLGAVGVARDARPETLAPRQFVVLLRALVDGGWPER